MSGSGSIRGGSSCSRVTKLPDAEEVVQRGTDWVVVEKRGQAGVVAESIDPEPEPQAPRVSVRRKRIRTSVPPPPRSVITKSSVASAITARPHPKPGFSAGVW